MELTERERVLASFIVDNSRANLNMITANCVSPIIAVRNACKRTAEAIGITELESESPLTNDEWFKITHWIADVMVLLAICEDDIEEKVKEKGYITLCEPTSGSGVLVTSFCKALAQSGLNYCSQLVVTAVDSDLKCVHMSYTQLSLYGIPAVVIHGDSILCKQWSRWYTPTYLMNGWLWKESLCISSGVCVEDEYLKCITEPTYAALQLLKNIQSGGR